MRIVILGCGRAGSQLASLLTTDGHEVTVLDVDGASFSRLPEKFGGQAIIGDGTDIETLRKIGIDKAQALVALTQNDNRNIMAAQIAKFIFKVPRVICRIYDPLRSELYDTLGIEAFSPTTMFAHHLRDKLSQEK
ncbi:MAG: TrkA family potassium uptake protein [Chloroflexota bacterium]